MRNTTIYIATHKLFMPPSNPIYKPVTGGASFHVLPYLKDNKGDNISDKNLYYSELTILYWIWKNSKSNTVGLVHYHRYFHNNEEYLSNENINKILKNYDVIVPEALNFPITVLEQYESVHYIEDLYLACQKIEEKDSSYQNSISHVLNGTRLYPYNMFISRKEFLNDYASFLFPILFELEKEIPYLEYSIYNQRVFGFLAERIFNIYLNKKGCKVYECPVHDTFSLKKQKQNEEDILKLLREEKKNV